MRQRAQKTAAEGEPPCLNRGNISAYKELVIGSSMRPHQFCLFFIGFSTLLLSNAYQLTCLQVDDSE